MSAENVIITDLETAPTYCRRFDGAAYQDYDTEAGIVFGTPLPMWEDNADLMYFGKATTFSSLGFHFYTAGDYATLGLAYWDGVGWSGLTPFHESTTLFNRHGYMAWVIPGDWALTTIDGVSAYWIKASMGTVTTTAEFFNFMLNITLAPPVILSPNRKAPLKIRDIDGQLQEADISYKGPTSLTIDCTQITLAMDDINLLWYFWHYGHNLHIYDGAQSATRDSDNDAFYLDYYGTLLTRPDKAMSPFKMDPKEYIIAFEIDQVSTLL